LIFRSLTQKNLQARGKGKDDWGSVELLKLIRKLQPGIIVDNRLNLEEYKDGADFETPEQVKH
jgi:alpha-L-fucosidase